MRTTETIMTRGTAMQFTQGNAMQMRTMLFSCAAVATFGSACGDSGTVPGAMDSGNNVDDDSGGQTGEVWTLSTIDTEHTGDQLRMALVSGNPVVAYYAYNAMNGAVCTEVGGTAPPIKRTYRLYYAALNGASWQRETVVDSLQQGSPPGISLSVESDGTPAIAAQSGVPFVAAMFGFCGSNDVGYYRRGAPGSWTLQTAVRTSGEAVARASDFTAGSDASAASNFGEAVGWWPAMAHDRVGNPVIAYKDIHGGGLQADDTRRADLEIARRNGTTWTASGIDFGRGAGEYNMITFDDMNRPVVVFYNPTADVAGDGRVGIWAARTDDSYASWKKVRLAPFGAVYGPAVAFDNTANKLRVAYYDPNRKLARVATLNDPTKFEMYSMGWTDETITADTRYDEGKYLSMDIDANGTIGIAYYRCVRTSRNMENCDPQDDALIFVWKRAGTTTWVEEVVDNGDNRTACGRYIGLRFLPSGEAAIAYGCETFGDAGVVSHVKFARRMPI